jgi:hypothetical protein
VHAASQRTNLKDPLRLVRQEVEEVAAVDSFEDEAMAAGYVDGLEYGGHGLEDTAYCLQRRCFTLDDVRWVARAKQANDGAVAPGEDLRFTPIGDALEAGHVVNHADMVAQ